MSLLSQRLTRRKDFGIYGEMAELVDAKVRLDGQRSAGLKKPATEQTDSVCPIYDPQKDWFDASYLREMVTARCRFESCSLRNATQVDHWARSGNEARNGGKLLQTCFGENPTDDSPERRANMRQCPKVASWTPNPTERGSIPRARAQTDNCLGDRAGRYIPAKINQPNTNMKPSEYNKLSEATKLEAEELTLSIKGSLMISKEITRQVDDFQNEDEPVHSAQVNRMNSARAEILKLKAQAEELGYSAARLNKLLSIGTPELEMV